MVGKTSVLSAEQIRSFDYLSGINDVASALGQVVADLLFGAAQTGAPTVVSGFTPSINGAAPTLAPESGGSLTGTLYYRVAAILGGIEQLASQEASITLSGGNGTVQVTFTAVAGATAYKIYRGTVANTENVYYTATASPFLDTGAVSTSGTPIILGYQVGLGGIYQVAALDGTQYGTLPANSSTIYQQGVAVPQTIALTTAALTSGKSQYALLEATFAQVDQVRSGDPNSGIVPFYSSANPTLTLLGQNNTGASQPTVRLGVASLRLVYGSPATTGSEVPPAPDSGYVPLYLVDLAFGTTVLSSVSSILFSGPGVGTGVSGSYPWIPLLSRLVGGQVFGVTTPTLAVGANIGSGAATPTIETGSTDTQGYISWTTGSGPAAGAQAIFTFQTSHRFQPTVLLSPANAATAALGVWPSSVGKTGFTVSIGAPSGSTAYSVSYLVMGS